MKIKQTLILLAIIVFCSVVSYALVVLAQEAPQWSNFTPGTETVVTILDPVTINVTWYDDGTLDTLIIWENSTGEWQGHNFGG